mgnify:FL=1
MCDSVYDTLVNQKRESDDSPSFGSPPTEIYENQTDKILMISRRKFAEVSLLSAIAFTGCMTDESGSDLIINNSTDAVIDGEITITKMLSKTQSVSNSTMSENPIIMDNFTLHHRTTRKSIPI